MTDEPEFHGTLGVLECDEFEDKLRCHLCGDWYRNLAQHVRLVHGLSAHEYREIAGLNRQTRLVSPGMRAHLREITAPFLAQSHREKYCPPCRPEALREYQRNWKRAKKQTPKS
jgi:hypothetical protein